MLSELIEIVENAMDARTRGRIKLEIVRVCRATRSSAGGGQGMAMCLSCGERYPIDLTALFLVSHLHQEVDELKKDRDVRDGLITKHSGHLETWERRMKAEAENHHHA